MRDRGTMVSAPRLVHAVQEEREKFLSILLPVLGASRADEVVEHVCEDPVSCQDGRRAKRPAMGDDSKRR